MKRTVELMYSNKATIPTGQYENLNPMYCQKTIYEVNGETFDEATELKNLQEGVDGQLNEHVRMVKNQVSGNISHLRIRERNGKKYPSVTSILNPEPYTGEPEYGIRGSEIHDMYYDYFNSGQWREPTKKLTKLRYSDIKYKEWWEKFADRVSFNDKVEPVEIYHEKYMYSGEIDFIMEVDKKVTLCDLKTGGWNWSQLVAYLKACKGDIEQLAIFDLKEMELKTIPVNSTKLLPLWEGFLLKRGVFRGKYSI